MAATTASNNVTKLYADLSRALVSSKCGQFDNVTIDRDVIGHGTERVTFRIQRGGDTMAFSLEERMRTDNPSLFYTTIEDNLRSADMRLPKAGPGTHIILGNNSTLDMRYNAIESPDDIESLAARHRKEHGRWPEQIIMTPEQRRIALECRAFEHGIGKDMLFGANVIVERQP